MKQIISLSILSITFDTAEMRRMNQALERMFFFDGSRKLERKLLLDTGTMANGNSC